MSPPNSSPLNLWLEALGRKYALGALALDEAGVCVLQYGSTLDVIIQAISGGETVLLEIPLMPIPGVNREVFFRRLLELNHRGEATRGASLSLNDQSQTVMLGVLAPIAQLDELALEQLIGNLIDCAESLMPMLDSVDSGKPDIARASASLGTPSAAETFPSAGPTESTGNDAGLGLGQGLGLRPGFLRG
jgi:hypothetical protein